MKNILLAYGTRPETIKVSALLKAFEDSSEIKVDLIDTGQHYDDSLAKCFYREFDITKYSCLGVGSGSYAWQISNIALKLEEIVNTKRYDMILLIGDTNSSIGCALAGYSAKVKIAHIEAGARSQTDRFMPEEVNRKFVDSVSSLFFTATENCSKNLLKEGVDKKDVYCVGDVLLDVLMQNSKRVEDSDVLKQFNLEPKSYIVLTFHRKSNLTEKNAKDILNAIEASSVKTIFPAHPNTIRLLNEFSIEIPDNVFVTCPFEYIGTQKLVKESALVVTDSGGLQREAFWHKVPCITLRDRTEWIETLMPNGNEVCVDYSELSSKIERKFGRTTVYEKNPFGNGDAAVKISRIVSELER